MKYLEVSAGKTALRTLQAEGFTQERFCAVLGASGGPNVFKLSFVGYPLNNG